MFLLKQTDNFMGNLSANTIKHVSKMELHIILSTLEKFECWDQSFNNEILAGEMVVDAGHPHSLI